MQILTSRLPENAAVDSLNFILRIPYPPILNAELRLLFLDLFFGICYSIKNKRR